MDKQHQDALGDVLSSLKVSGQILLAEEYQPPWGIAIPGGVELARELATPRQSRVVPFHFVRRGSFELHRQNTDPLIVRAGEIAICTGSQSHHMIQGEPERVVPFPELLRESVNPLSARGQGGSTELVCGVFLLNHTVSNPFVEALPAVIHADAAAGLGGHTLDLLMRLLLAELRMTRDGSAYMASRLVELVCAESLRQYLDQRSHLQPGWFRGMREPKIAAALRAIHAAPEAEHAVGSLAAGVNLSASRFAARFREVMGESVMSYVTRWRMNLACRLLTETDASVEQVGCRVGYDSAPSFSRAFTRRCGVSPSRFRNAQFAAGAVTDLPA